MSLLFKATPARSTSSPVQHQSSRKKIKKKKQPRLIREDTKPTCEVFSILKSSIACPSHHLQVLLKQTDLDESSIHLRYMKFRQEFPTGFIGPQAMINLCSGVLGHKEAEAFAEKIFSLYGRNRTVSRKGWNTRLIGFREVILATENIHFLTQPEKIMRWIFKIHDYNGTGFISVFKISEIVDQILCLCTCEEECSSEDGTPEVEGNQDLKEAIMSNFAEMPYETPTISEDEFVYDALNNDLLFAIVKKSSLLPP